MGMAIDENSAPTESRPLNPNRTSISSPDTPFPIVSSSTSATTDHTFRMVKILCSYGGGIIPRPGDGTLRYAGGNTRIISISCRISFRQFHRKMVDVYGGPVSIRYQIPYEELDVLISVSSSEDLDNMMREYDELADASLDGSVRFRIFLFSPSEIAFAASEIYTYGLNDDTHDIRKTYIEAINGVVTGGIQQKDSIATAASIQKLVVPGDDLANDGKSATASATWTTTDDSHDPSSVSFLGNTTSETEYQGFTTNSTVFGRTDMISQTPNPPPVAPYASRAVLANDGKPATASATWTTTDASHDPSSVSFLGNAISETEYQGFTTNPSVFGRTEMISQTPNPPPVAPYASRAVLGNDGKSATAFSPWTAIDDSHDPSSVSFLGNTTSETEYQGFTTNSTVFGRTDMISQTPNPPPVSPYDASWAFLDIQQDQCIDPHSLPMDGGHEMVNAGAVPQLLNLSPLHISSPSVPSYLEILNRNQGAVKPSVDENLNGERILQFTPNGNYEDFPLSGSDLPSFHHSNMQPQNEDHYGLHPLPPLPELLGFGLEDYHMPQKPLPHANSDAVLIESYPTFPTHDSEDIIGLQSQHREVKVDVWESMVKPKLESIVNPCQFDVSWLNQNSVEISKKENFVLPNANDFDHSKSKQSLNPTGLSGENLHETFKDFPQLYQTEKLHGQRHVLHGKNFNVNNYFYLPTTTDFSNAYRNFYGASPCPPQPVHYNSWQQNMLQPAELFNHGMFFQRPGIYSPTVVMSMKPSGMFLMENREYLPQPCMNNFAQEMFHDYVKPVDGMMEALHALDFERMKLNEKINQAVANRIVSKDMRTEISPLVGEQNHGTRLQNGANMFIGNNTIFCPGNVPECVSVGANNPTFSNTGFTKNMNPEISSVLGEERSTMRPHNCADILLSRNPFLSSGILPQHSTNANLTPASVLNNDLLSQIFEGNMEPSVLHDVKPGITTHCPTEYGYGIAINKSSDEELKDEAPLVHPMDLNNDMSDFQRGSVPFPFSKSSSIPWHIQQLIMTSCSDSFFCYQDPWGRWPQRPSMLGGDESVLKDTFYENFFENNKCPDNMAVLSEEGALQSPAYSLNNNSPPRPFQMSQGSIFLKQDVGELAKQVGESVLKSLTNYPPASCSPASNESNPTFTNLISIGEGMKSSNNTAVPLADDIVRLQVIKNVDLQDLQELGSGTFGTVFYGKWRGSEVAIKRINDRCFTGKPSEQERMRIDFWNEASKLADLHHPNVLAFYGIVLDDPDRSFATVTEYMVDGSLRNALQCNENTFDRRKRLQIASDVAFGMEYLHAKNIVHFDLKSDNLLVNLRDPRRPVCKVGDLGLSKVKCKTLISGGLRGTLPWMAPELLSGSSNLVSEKVDVFSFGIVMWELLTGQEPYANLHYGAIIGGIVNNTLRPPVPESCDLDWKVLMERCWSAEPSSRPSFTQIARILAFMEAFLS